MTCSPTSLPDAWRDHDWQTSPAARAIARAFTPPPDLHIWQWADENVRIQNEDSPEPGEYRSAKTPWTRRLQELMRVPEMWMWDYTAQAFVKVPVHEISVQKSSQSGFSEACMNGIRWRATYRPCNTIYAIDSATEAAKIARRLLRSFKFLDESIFTGDPNDIKTLEFKLRGMELLFYGSGSEGKFANKQAPLRIADEAEEHLGDNTLDNLDSRGKGAAHGGLQINLSKPKHKGGPINKAFAAGTQEEFFVPCPHCQAMQPLTFFPKEIDVTFSDDMVDIHDDLTGKVVARMPKPLPLGEKRKFKTGRIVFEHCKNLLEQWDQLRILTDTYYECGACKGRIDEDRKRWMIDRGEWRCMVFDGTPGVVSQHFSDLYSEDDSVTWGRLVLRWLKLKRKGIEGMRTFYNHYLGEAWSEEANATETADILANIAGKALWFVDGTNSESRPVRHVFTDRPSADRLCESNAARGLVTPVIESVCPPYRRGTVPWPPITDPKRGRGLIIGSDVGGSYACWIAIAPHDDGNDVAVIDWGWELDPDAVARVADKTRWPCGAQQFPVIRGFMDARHRAEDVYKACLFTRGQMIPVHGVGGESAKHVKVWTYAQVATYRKGFMKLDFNDQRAKTKLYIERIKRKWKRVWFPADIEDDPEFIDQLCQEKQEENTKGKLYWPDNATGNHYGDCLKMACVGLDFMLRGAQPASAADEDEAEA
ncbi:MAG: terminase gpA endonuclease subunit [Chthoniobacteraceae bacterium]